MLLPIPSRASAAHVGAYAPSLPTPLPFCLSLQLALFAAILGSVYFDASESYVIAGQLYKLVDAPSQVLQAQVAILFYEGLSGVYRHERAAGACSPALLLLQHQLHCLAWILPPQVLLPLPLPHARLE